MSTADMTPAEYKRSDTPGTYEVRGGGAVYRVSGLHSATAVNATIKGEIKRVGE